MRAGATLKFRRIVACAMACATPLAMAAGDDTLAPVRDQERFQAVAIAFHACATQRLMLDEVARLHPSLASRVDLVRMKFIGQTGDACTGLDAMLEAVSANQRGLRAKLIAGASKKAQPALLALSDAGAASALIEQVSLRADGGLDPLVAPAMIDGSREYRRNPAAQWPRWTKAWDFAGQPKAHGVAASVRVPVAFEEKAPVGPGALRVWKQALPPKGAHVMLMVEVTPHGKGGMAAAVKRLERGDAASLGQATVAPVERGVLLESRITSMLRRPALLVKFDMVQRQLDLIIPMRMIIVSANAPEGRIALTCGVVGVEPEGAEMRKYFDRYEPLCTLFFNSLIAG
jgi:hypothetical protein